MISDLLDFTRGRLGGGIPIAPARIALRPLIQRVVEEAGAAHPGAHIRLTGASDDLEGEWDPDRLAQLVTNLIGNAIQHGRPRAPVRVTLEERGPRVLIQVHNQGPPIPPGELTHVFEPFRRAAGDAVAPGLGLGLFIVQEIARAHGGEVTARSDALGTDFQVSLPRAQSPPGAR
jgi:signal transduction histidine kinase